MISSTPTSSFPFPCAVGQHGDCIATSSVLLASSDGALCKRPWTDLISPYKPLLTFKDSSSIRLAHPPRPPLSPRQSLVDSTRLVPSIPRKRSMQASSEQPSYGHPLPVPSPPLSRCSDSLASPARDAFFPSPGHAGQPDNDTTTTTVNTNERYIAFHRYRNSASTSASVSTSSSPTTSNSLLDSCAVDTPATSPDTPASTHSYNYPSLSMAIRTTQDQKSELRAVPAPFSKKPRNLKNLAVNTSSTFPPIRAISTAALPMDPPKSPSTSSSISLSPSFVVPSNPPRRRPHGPGLTIQTPATGTFPLPQAHPPMPSTPNLNRPAALRSFQSSPSLPLFSAGLPPEGGMRLPNFASALSSVPSEIDEYHTSPGTTTTTTAPYDLPQSQEAKPDAYPHGPICIYDPHVYLYFEPTAEEASNYDVIFNVASEVQNPFSAAGQSHVRSVDLQAAVKALAESSSSPSTPRPATSTTLATDTVVQDQNNRPEYIHVPWEHNTDIVPGSDTIPSLHDIIRIIDSRVTQGKRVLIHCQCGVSRSASLIVAYGLYKNPSITVQQAYEAVKQKSEWIGPNMNLIMQLQEFRNILLFGSARSVPPQQKPATRLHGRAMPANGDESKAQDVPQTAPLPQQSPKLSPPPLITQNLRDVSPGPSSAPSDFHWPSSARVDTATPIATDRVTLAEPSVVDAAGQLVSNAPSIAENPLKTRKASLAIRTDVNPISASQNLPQPVSSMDQLASPRSTEFAMAPLRAQGVEDMFGLTSPRPVELSSSPNFAPSSIPSPAVPSEPLSSGPADFAMTSIHQPAYDETFGLTSPRTTTTFTTPLPHRPQQETTTRVAVLQPPVDASQANAQARAELRSQLGFNSTRSQTDMRAAYTEAAPLQTKAVVPIPVPPRELVGTLDVSDALMSPRATEFTNNPFHDALDDQTLPKSMHEVPAGGDVTPVALDPRSPPLKGGSPIVRNIFDVL